MTPPLLPPPLPRRAVVLSLVAWPWLATAATAAQPARTAEAPPALLLARDAWAHVDPAGYLVSEKYDGVRALWDGHRLRFRGGANVAAPAWFLAGLPAGQALDGELWLDRGRFDELSALVRRERPDDAAWRRVRYMVFELPGGLGTFAQRSERLRALALLPGARTWEPAVQQTLTGSDALRDRLAEVLAAQGEGLMLHWAASPYVTGRSEWLLKLKPVQDAEAVVVGHTPGRGQFAGQVGALQVRDDSGRTFLVGSGLTGAQRVNPPPLGSVVTYTWRGETANGLPRFPALLRLRPAGL